MIAVSDFCKIVNAVREHTTMIDKLGDALGVVPVDMYQLGQVILDYMEKLTQREWTDDIWNSVYSTNKCAEDVYSSIIELSKSE